MVVILSCSEVTYIKLLLLTVFSLCFRMYFYALIFNPVFQIQCLMMIIICTYVCYTQNKGAGLAYLFTYTCTLQSVVLPRAGGSEAQRV